jgi:thioesterase domain-containing protein
MPSATGSLLLWKRFLPHVDAEQPVFGLTLPSTATGAPLFSDFETLAARCAERLMATRSEGAFRLAGFSIGAALAYEVARQLHLRGREVESLVMIDVHANRERSSVIEWLRLVPSYLLNFPLWIMDDVLQSSRSRLRERLRINFQKIGKRLFGRYNSERFRIQNDEDLPKPGDAVSAAYISGFQSYRPTRFPGPITLIRTRSQSPFEFRCYDYGWGKVTRHVDVRIVGGCYHHQLVEEPHVATVAVVLQKALDTGEIIDSGNRNGPGKIVESPGLESSANTPQPKCRR